MSHDALMLKKMMKEKRLSLMRGKGRLLYDQVASSPSRMDYLGDSRPAVTMCEIEIVGSENDVNGVAAQPTGVASHVVSKPAASPSIISTCYHHGLLVSKMPISTRGDKPGPGQDTPSYSYKSSKWQLARVRVTFSAHEASQARMMKRRFSALTHHYVFPSSLIP